MDNLSNTNRFQQARGSDDAVRGGGVHPIGDVLEELLTRYCAAYPELRVSVIETPAIRPHLNS